MFLVPLREALHQADRRDQTWAVTSILDTTDNVGEASPGIGQGLATMSIPAIDMSRFHSGGPEARRSMAAALASACGKTGFFHVTGHRVERRVILTMREMTAAFFRLPAEEKRALCAAPGDYRGYIPFAAFGNNTRSGEADLYEGFKLHREVEAHDPIREACDLYGPNRWPVRIPGFRRAVLDYWRAMDALSEELLRLFALALGLGEGRLLPCFEEPLTNMTLLHYPPVDRRCAGSGIHPHRDIDAFTIVHPGDVPGLEVLTRDRRWIEVTAPEGALVVNVGNMMELWSGGRFVSAPHRVTPPSGAPRYSFPYFAMPRHDVLVEPLLPRVEGFDRAAVQTGFIVRELYRTNWKSLAQSDPEIDAGTVK